MQSLKGVGLFQAKHMDNKRHAHYRNYLTLQFLVAIKNNINSF